MRINLSFDLFSWLRALDYKKVIIVAFLLRLTTASAYDIFVSLSGKDTLLPDSRYYSMYGSYIALSLIGYDKLFSMQHIAPRDLLIKKIVPEDRMSQDIFLDIVANWKGSLPSLADDGSVFYYIIGFIYLFFGYFPLGVRIFNIFLSILGTFLLFKVSKRQFGELTANAFLVAALFLPTQFGYSVTMSKDFIRMFLVSFILWVIYG